MAERLPLGSTFPTFTASTVQGDTLTLPGDAQTRYQAAIFYRAHW